MKKLFFMILILPYTSINFINGQESLSIKKWTLDRDESFSTNRERVWETLSNLPIERSDWRYDDLRKNFLKKWQREIFGTAIIYVNGITASHVETPSMYYANTPEGDPSRIELDSSKFTFIDDEDHCVEHELGHAAFLGTLNVPGWLLYLGDKTAKVAGSENSMPYERIVRAIVVRRDIIDHFDIPINSLITSKQLQDYLESKAERMDFGLNWLIETTKKDMLLFLVNFENGYLLTEKARAAKSARND